MKTNEVNLFFIGGRSRGYLWVQSALKRGEKIVGAIVMKEDPHEVENFSEKISKLLLKESIPYFVAKNIKEAKYLNFIKRLSPSVIIVMGWRTIIPKQIIEIPPRGTVAVHESLLPKYRGFAPVNWSIINGEKQTGVTLFYIDKGTDSGDIISQQKVSISPEDTGVQLYEKTSSASVQLLEKFLPKIKSGKAPRRKQVEAQATYTCKRIPSDGLINWESSTMSINNLIRSLSYPYPNAFSYLNGEKIFITKSKIPKQKNYVGKIPGRVISIDKTLGVEILTGDGTLLVQEISLDGKKPINPSEVLTSISFTFSNEKNLL